ALIVLGASVVVLGAGLLLMAGGLMIFAAAMTILTVMGASGATALGYLFEKLVSFIDQAPALLAMSGVILALGAGVLLLGAGLLILGLGALAASGGLAVLQLVAQSGGQALIYLANAVMISSGSIP